MEPTRNHPATLVDLLDRVLDKGLVINADLIICLAGIPLIGVNLRAVLAGMETMVRYGVMRGWDERIRTWEREQRRMTKPPIALGERVVLEIRGAYACGYETNAAWRMGRIYLTDRRLILYHATIDVVLFETPLDRIIGLTTEGDDELRREERSDLYLWLEGDRVARLRVPDTGRLREALQAQMAAIAVAREERLRLPAATFG